jgi:acyl-CoA synthetase (AMP-forming)/AMP-acid ligase II
VLLSPFGFLDHPSDAPVLVDAREERIWTQDELSAAVQSFSDRLQSGRRELVFCLCGSDVASVIGYLGAVRARHAVALLAVAAPAHLTEALIDRYRPAFVVGPGRDATIPTIRTAPAGSSPAVADELGVLLSTSGTTGSPKLVRLSYRNVAANAASIVEYLGIERQERAILSLPIHYSYGLSVLHSHLAIGASLVLTSHSIIRREFWRDASRWSATSFAGVPYSYVMLERTGLLREMLPETMHTLTVAGGRLDPSSVIAVHDLISVRGGRLFVMYGQTEATARISYVPPEALPDKAHTIGVPIPRGRLTVRSEGEEIAEPDVEGELVYSGPNVMLGYAEHPGHLAFGDQLQGELHTGDLGSFDEDGFFRVTGRMKRIAKITGLRINLDEIEAAASIYGPVAAVDAGERILIFRPTGAQIAGEDLRRELAHRFGLNSRAFAVREIERLPIAPSGKLDYETLVRNDAG